MMAQSAAVAENLLRAFITASEPVVWPHLKGRERPVVVPLVANTSIFRTTSR